MKATQPQTDIPECFLTYLVVKECNWSELPPIQLADLLRSEPNGNMQRYAKSQYHYVGYYTTPCFI